MTIEDGHGVELSPGDRVGNLTVERELGRGAYGAVYLARDILIGRPVALKVLLSRGAPDSEREAFLAEARVIGGIPSPHIVTLYAVHESEDGGWLIEMEYVDGGSLHDTIEAGQRLSAGQATPIVRGVLHALRAAHERGVLHRDIKPGNVLIGRDSTVKLADFGLALVAGEPLSTAHGDAIVGTPWYMAPELFLGQPAAVQSDLWAAGVMIHEMLMGDVPFGAQQLPALIHEIRSRPPPALRADVAPTFSRIVQRCLSKRPEDRPRSAAELLEDLDRVSGRSTTIVARPIGSGRLYGRSAEVRRIVDVMRSVDVGRAAVLAIFGDAGLGKSALLEEAQLAAGSLGYTWLPVLAARSGLIRPLLRAVRGVLAGDGGDEALEDRLVSGDFGRALPTLRLMLQPGANLEIQSREQAIWALESLMRGLAADGPVGLAVDGLHLADEDDVALLHELAARLATSRFMLLVSRRPSSEGPPRVGRPDGVAIIERIELGGLEPEALFFLLEDRAGGGRRIQPRIVERIARRSGGNPLLALELFRHLQQTGAVQANDEAWLVTKAWDETELPDGLRDVFVQRLDQLDDDDRELLEAAATDGVRFDGQTLAAVLETPSLTTLRHLQRLVRKGGLIHAAGTGFEFEHAVLRDTLYEEIAPELRKAMHAALATHLESRADTVDPERLGTHWEQAGDPARAGPYLIAAAASAIDRQERRRGLELIARTGVLEGTPDLDLFARHGEALSKIALAYRDMHRFDDALRLYTSLREAAGRKGNDLLAAAVDVQIVLTRYFAGTSEPADRERLLTAAETLPQSRERGFAYYGAGLLAGRGGERGLARECYEKADAVFLELGLDYLRAASMSRQASLAFHAGDAPRAIELWKEAAGISDRAGRRSNAATDRMSAASAAISIGQLDGQREMLETSLRTFELEGAYGKVAVCRSYLADVCYSLGDLPAAAQQADLAVSGVRRTTGGYALAASLIVAARLDIARGRLDNARMRLDEAAAIADEIGVTGLRPHELVARALLAACTGHRDIAASQVLEALDASEQRGESPEFLIAESLSACVLGVGERAWSRARKAVAAADDLPGTVREIYTAAATGAIAFARGDGSADDLMRAADALEDESVGNLRAELRVVALWFRSAAHRRQGNERAAFEESERAASAASLLGNVWLEAAILRALDRDAGPSQERRDRRSMLVRRVTAELAPGELRDAITSEWAPVRESP